jgi:hypothetical protein
MAETRDAIVAAAQRLGPAPSSLPDRLPLAEPPPVPTRLRDARRRLMDVGLGPKPVPQSWTNWYSYGS